ncbi:MAG: glycoside hydrolase family 1 protein [Anaerolineales bacterium]|nr:glycoside hydrolase family 1 protein [Anaerolineales bacterium]
MARATHSFPASFLWGTATSAYQYEGHGLNTDFYAWEQEPGRIAQGHTSGAACDWWGGRWAEDFDRAANDGHNALRLSVEWARVEPKMGEFDDAALDHYRQMVAGLRARGLTPLVTLHHFVNPLWLADTKRNGWEHVDVVARFANYVRRVVTALKDYVDLWATINEPNVYMVSGWLMGTFPPGKKLLAATFNTAQNLVRAHAAAYRVIHELQPHAQVGLPIHFRPILPAQPGFVLDEWVAENQFKLFSSFFLDALTTGKLRRPFGFATAVPEAKGTHDYVGLNYYSADVARFDVTNPQELFGRRTFPPDSEPDGSGVYASYPSGFMESFKWLEKLRLPIYVTENGIGDEADGLRRRYLVQHIRQMWRAVNFNWDVRGYFHWSLVDNFEWERGWTHRFGLYALDPATQTRTPRPSARLYSAICQSNSLSSDIVAEHTPELLAGMFPG